ncbi:guanylate kinase [Coemansia biformis]|uniref:Guanylate kinase n=1 Tax=Coemansia biformis TaxID=1286918 RepID=A0A9W7YBR6_9FUNG|nr:guanylate kinase [Coemansia biformis]
MSVRHTALASLRALSTMSATAAAAGKRPVVVFGPSGTGKSTLLKRLFAEHPQEFGFSVSNTTRDPRAGEVNGKDYHFLTREQFLEAVARKEFIEHAEFSGNMYGTTVRAVKDVADAGKTCILDIDVQGVKSVKDTDLGARFVFVAPPSEEELERRLRSRGTDNEASILKRLQVAKGELEYGNQPGSCDIRIVNDDVDSAYKTLSDFIFERADSS